MLRDNVSSFVRENGGLKASKRNDLAVVIANSLGRRPKDVRQVLYGLAADGIVDFNLRGRQKIASITVRGAYMVKAVVTTQGVHEALLRMCDEDGVIQLSKAKILQALAREMGVVEVLVRPYFNNLVEQGVVTPGRGSKPKTRVLPLASRVEDASADAQPPMVLEEAEVTLAEAEASSPSEMSVEERLLKVIAHLEQSGQRKDKELANMQRRLAELQEENRELREALADATAQSLSEETRDVFSRYADVIS